jgi:hypothetical protein
MFGTLGFGRSITLVHLGCFRGISCRAEVETDSSSYHEIACHEDRTNEMQRNPPP